MVKISKKGDYLMFVHDGSNVVHAEYQENSGKFPLGIMIKGYLRIQLKVVKHAIKNKLIQK